MEVRVRINQAKQTTWGSLGFHELDEIAPPIHADSPNLAPAVENASPYAVSPEALAMLLRRLELVVKVSGMMTFEIFRGLWYIYSSVFNELSH
jgi:hypothetical protein